MKAIVSFLLAISWNTTCRTAFICRSGCHLTINRREDKGDEMKYKQTDAGHDWSNWRPLVDDVLVYVYGSTKIASGK